MEHFSHLAPAVVDRLFAVPPLPVTPEDDRDTLATALGATLYTPSTRDNLAARVVKLSRQGLTSMVMCLEDSIGDDEVAAGEANIVTTLAALRAHDPNDLPLLFVRVRSPEQMPDLARRCGDDIGILTGFVMPKFDAHSGQPYLQGLNDARRLSSRPLYGMPVLESPQVIHAHTRQKALSRVEKVLKGNRKKILAIRIGATDFLSAYGLRRNPDHTIYDVRVVSEVISDIVNRMGRADKSGFVVTGPVWEFFTAGERIFKPRLRVSLFEDHDAAELRAMLVSRDMDGLIREVEFDKANGIQGKTVIHPSHVAVVNALQVVTYEEYTDALDILGSEGGATSSTYRNKMNETKPHSAWASRTMLRARVFGVAAHDVSFVQILAAHVDSVGEIP